MHQRALFLKHVAQTSAFPLAIEIDRSEGVYLYDTNGKQYLDLISGIGVSSIGHRHPDVVEAVKNQTDKYLHTMVYGEYVLSPQVELASLLAQHLPDPLESVYFVNSGTEATEGAMKLAKRFTGRHEIIACKRAYHGSTQGAASLMNPTDFTQAFYPLLPGVHHIEFNCEFCLRKITENTAAVIVETVQGESGIKPPRPGYLKALRDRCTEVGALLILDEIQAGYGRTGSLFAFSQHEIVPDILLLAKGMGGGMPIGAFISSKEIMWSLTDNPILGHITTFGGHPVNCAAGLATLKLLLNERLWEGVPQKEARFRERLVHPAIKEIRSAGLMMGVEVSSFDQLKGIIDYCLEHGLIVDWFLFNDYTMRIAPPLIITDEQIDWACSIILEALDRV